MRPPRPGTGPSPAGPGAAGGLLLSVAATLLLPACPPRVVRECPPVRGERCPAARRTQPRPPAPPRPRGPKRFSLRATRQFQMALRIPQPRTVAISPDGTLVAVGGRWGGLQLLRLSDGAVQANLGRTEELSAPLRVAFSPDGGLLVSAGHDGGKVRVWSTRPAKLLREFRTRGYPIHDLAVGDAGLALLGTRAGAEVWDVRTGAHRRTESMPYHLPAVRVAACPSGMLAAGDRTGTVQVFAGDGSRPPQTIPSPGRRLTALALSPGGDLLAAGYENGRVQLIRTDSGKPVRRFAYYGASAPLRVRFPRSGRDVLVAGADGRVEQVDLRTGRVLARLTVQDKLADPGRVALAQDGSLVALVRAGRTLTLWQSAGQRESLRLPPRVAPPPLPRPPPRVRLIRPTGIRIDVSGFDVSHYAVGRRGQFLALAGPPVGVRVYYLNFTPRPGRRPRAIPLYRRAPPVRARPKKDASSQIWIAATPDRKWLLAHGGGFYLHRWAFATGRPIPSWVRQRGPLRGLLPLHDNRTVLTLAGPEVLAWSLAGNLRYRFRGLPQPYFWAVSPDSRSLALVQGWDHIAVYDLPTGRLRWSRPSGRDRARSLLAMVIPPGSQRLLTYHENGFLRVYDLALGAVRLRRRLPPPPAGTRCAFRPDGKVLACAHRGGVVYLEVPSGAHVGSLEWPRGVTVTRVRDLAYSTKGNVLVAQVSRRQLVAFGFDHPDQRTPYRGVEALVRLRLGLSIRPPRIRVRPSALPRRELLPSRGTLRHRIPPRPRAAPRPRARR